MTNQTAVTILKNLEQSLDDYCELNDEGKEAFHMAITALELFGISEQLPSAQPKVLACGEGELIAQPERTEYIPDTKAVPSKRDCVDLAERVTATFYDQEYEEWTQKSVTIADVLDSVCDDYTILPSAQPDTDMVSRQLMRDLGAMCIARRDEGDDLVPILSIDLLPPASESNAPKTLDDNCLSPTKEANTSDRSIN